MITDAVGVAAVLMAILLLIGVLYLFIGDLMGAPFVPTEEKFLKKLFSEIKLKKGKTFWDLGSGDGRVVRFAIHEFGMRGVGIEINPFLIFYSRFISENAVFKRENFWNSDLSGADYIYFYLSPPSAEKLGRKFIKEKVRALIISKAFRIAGWEKKLVREIEVEGRLAFVYQL